MSGARANGEGRPDLSQDDIVFDEVKYREPERRRRPDRDRRWASLAYEVPGPADLPIFLDRLAADAIERHALRDTTVELGGILLGKECLDDETGEPFVWVTKSIEAKHFENTQASFTYTHDSWEEITRERDRLFPDLDIVGWYHTHPDFGVFLSSHDLFIHHHFFAQPLQVAYVVDPIRQTRGFFQWRGERMDQVGGFFLTADRGDRNALARFVNDLENLPNTHEGGGGLSPRLEAELIAMLTRPTTQHGTAVDRTLTAGLFSLFGMMAGVIAVLAVIWLGNLNKQLQEQVRTLEALEKAVERGESSRRLALDALLGDAKGGPERFTTEYDKAVALREKAEAKLADQEAANDTLAARVRELQDLSKALKTDLETAKHYEKDAKEAGDLREQVANLKEQTSRQTRTIEEQEEVLDTLDGKKAAAHYRKYERTWYVALAGWIASALLAIGLVAAIAQLKPESEEEGAMKGPPEHRIE